MTCISNDCTYPNIRQNIFFLSHHRITGNHLIIMHTVTHKHTHTLSVGIFLETVKGCPIMCRFTLYLGKYSRFTDQAVPSGIKVWRPLP